MGVSPVEDLWQTLLKFAVALPSGTEDNLAIFPKKAGVDLILETVELFVTAVSLLRHSKPCGVVTTP